MASASANVRCINYYDLCRLCTDSTEQKTNIYSPEGRAKNLSHKILECLSLQIDEKDRLPKGVCNQCVQTVEQMQGFRATCRNSQTMLNNCLSIRPPPSSDKLYIRDAVDESGKSLGVVEAAPAIPTSSAGVQQSGNLLNSIIQAVGMQPQQQYTITVNNGLNQQPAQFQPPPPETQAKSEKQTALEEFIRLKPDIKITPLSKKDTSLNVRSQQPPTLQPQAVSCSNTTVSNPQVQLQPQLGDQLQPLWQQIQQLQLQQQLQQLTSQLQATQFASAPEDPASHSDSKKPKLNFVISSAAPQFTTPIQQFGSGQPQIQLQLMPGGGGVGMTGAIGANAQPQFNAAALLSSLATPQSAPNMLSPNKCFLPITIRDENSDQQIVAHIDTKNLVLPTTYQVQMKLQPQLATADGQPIMQLTPTSIPATLQLTPQTPQLGNPAPLVTQNQFVAPHPPLPQPQPLSNQQTISQHNQQLPPHTAQVTSQQIIRSPHSNTTSPQLVIRNVNSTPPTLSTPTSSKEPTVFKTPSPRQGQVLSAASKAIAIASSPALPSGGVNITATQEFKRLVPQAKPQTSPAVAAPQTQIPSNRAALQRLSSNTTITKVTKPLTPVPAVALPPTSAPSKMPLLNKQNITISRISMLKLPTPAPSPAPGPQPIPLSVPALSKTQPPPLASQHKKIMRKPTENQETGGQKMKNVRPQQILLLPQLEGQQKSSISGDAATVGLGSSLICPTCNREFKKKEHLTQHVKLHAGLRPFKCSEEDCDKAFSRKEHLSRHLISHTGQKMYTCEVCRKPFSRKDNLNKHQRIHAQPTNETLFCCDICNKNFATKQHYEKHREMHKKIRPDNSATDASAASSDTSASGQVRSNGQLTNKQQQKLPLQQSHSQTQSQQAQIMHVVTTQDLAGNTITITQAPDSNMPTSLTNFVQLGFPTFQNSSAPATNQLVCKLEK
ncbi:hypothetical protein KR009_004275 [Drosophila setifemur]|nr:hypothetical protein KR009_004275 [Drosophila setifemur]